MGSEMGLASCSRSNFSLAVSQFIALRDKAMDRLDVQPGKEP